jgi:hypothetical protein
VLYDISVKLITISEKIDLENGRLPQRGEL